MNVRAGGGGAGCPPLLDGGGQTGAKGSISYLSNSVLSSFLSLVACFIFCRWVCMLLCGGADIRRESCLEVFVIYCVRFSFFVLLVVGGWERGERREYVLPLF